MIRELLIATAAAVVGGLVVAGVVGYLNAPQSAQATASYDWIDVPNPVYPTDISVFVKAKAEAAARIVQIPADVFEKIWARKSLRVVEIEIRNPTSRRIKGIEITAPDAVAYQIGDESYITGGNVSISAIDPGEARNIIALTTSSGPHNHYEIGAPKTLQEGNIIPVVSARIDDVQDIFGFAKFHRANPFLAGMLFVFGNFCLILVISGLILAAYINSSIPRRAQITSAAEIAKLRGLIGYIDSQEEHKS